ncbi:MAG: tetratricopeptide repeat protein [Bacteroidota bacterium]
MSSLIPGYEYDIFISYRQKDNRHDGWVTEFVNQLKGELEATFKEDISIYFDENPHDGLLETHNVDKSLEDKLKCLIFIPIISQTYCDPKSYAWQNEFRAFNKLAKDDRFGRDIKLASGNVAGRILPVKIHDLDPEDKALLENELGEMLRGVDFIYKEPGINRPLILDDSEDKNVNKTNYRNQLNKVANAIKEIITALKKHSQHAEEIPKEATGHVSVPHKNRIATIIISSVIALVLIVLGILFIPGLFKPSEEREKAIAVLPFENDSPDQERMYFINGIMEAILDNLCKIEDLRVRGRTSVEQYRGNLKPVPTIAKELDVDYIIEGSGHRDGSRVRLFVQLLDARKDKHLWSKTYDADIEDIFSMQIEIAKLVAAEIKIFITPEEKQLIEKIPAANLEAYDLHLQAQDFYYKYLASQDRKYLEKVTQLAYIALELDPEFALAYYWIGTSFLSEKNLFGYGRQFYLDTALYFFDKALEMDPTLENAYSARGIYFYEKGQIQNAIDDLEKAISISPNNSVGYLNLGIVYSQDHDYINALINLRKAEKLQRASQDLSVIYNHFYWVYLSIGDIQKAESCLDKIRNLNLDLSILESAYGWILTIQGKWEELLAVSKKNNRTNTEALLVLGRFQEALDSIMVTLNTVVPDLNNAHRIGIIFWMNGKKKEALKYFNQQIEFCKESIENKNPYGTGGAAYDLAGVYAVLGNKEEAYKWLREYEKIGFNHGIHEYIKVDIMFDNLRNDEEFQQIVKRANDKADELRARINEMEERGEL